MIDTHCHLLPGVDDGARSQLEAIEMARRLLRFGVRRVVCTPHYSRRFPTAVPTARERLEALRHALEVLGVPIELDLAAEVSPELALVAPGEEILARALPGRYGIVELVATTPASRVAQVLERYASLDLRPIFAHPERCLAIQRDPALVDDVRSAGAMVQVVATSLVGRADRKVATAAWELLDARRVDLLGTDAHRPRLPQIQLGPVASLVARRYGDDVVQALTKTNPARILQVWDDLAAAPSRSA